MIGELFTLTRSFVRTRVVEDYSTLIWNERYITHGDFEIHTKPTTENIALLTNGTFLGLEGVREPMIIENRLLQGDKLVISGPSLTSFLRHRAFNFAPTYPDFGPVWETIPQPWHRNWEITGVPGLVMVALATRALTQPSPWPEYSDSIIPNLNVIHNLGIPADDPYTFALPYGELYAALLPLANTYQIGFTLYPESVDPIAGTYALVLRFYKGIRRTSIQTIVPPIRFSRRADTLTDVKELQSIARYVDGIMLYVSGVSKEFAEAFGVGPTASFLNGNRGLDRRIKMIFADDIRETDFGGMEGGARTVTAINLVSERRARDAIIENTNIQAVDGVIAPHSSVRYGVDYNLGDVVEFESDSGAISYARVSEYIRIKDENGEREYPTVDTNQWRT